MSIDPITVQLEETTLNAPTPAQPQEPDAAKLAEQNKQIEALSNQLLPHLSNDSELCKALAQYITTHPYSSFLPLPPKTPPHILISRHALNLQDKPYTMRIPSVRFHPNGFVDINLKGSDSQGASHHHKITIRLSKKQENSPWKVEKISSVIGYYDTDGDPNHKILQLAANALAFLDGRHYKGMPKLHDIIPGGQNPSGKFRMIIHMENFDGNLRQMAPPSSLIKRVQVADQTICCLTQLHALLICHNDLKPENILQKNDGAICRITDFETMSKRPIKKGIGSCFYFSPEKCLTGKVEEDRLLINGYKADVFALGLILLEICYGFHPLWDQNDAWRNHQVMQDQIRQYFETHETLEGLPIGKTLFDKQLIALCKSMTHRDPDKRPSMDAVFKAFRKQEFAGQYFTNSQKPSSPQKAPVEQQSACS